MMMMDTFELDLAGREAQESLREFASEAGRLLTREDRKDFKKDYLAKVTDLMQAALILTDALEEIL